MRSVLWIWGGSCWRLRGKGSDSLSWMIDLESDNIFALDDKLCVFGFCLYTGKDRTQ
jgi:hypothetical protein